MRPLPPSLVKKKIQSKQKLTGREGEGGAANKTPEINEHIKRIDRRRIKDRRACMLVVIMAHWQAQESFVMHNCLDSISASITSRWENTALLKQTVARVGGIEQ